MKRKEAKIYFFSFAKRSENQAKRDAVSLFSLRSEKEKQAKMGHPSVLPIYGTAFRALMPTLEFFTLWVLGS